MSALHHEMEQSIIHLVQLSVSYGAHAYADFRDHGEEQEQAKAEIAHIGVFIKEIVIHITGDFFHIGKDKRTIIDPLQDISKSASLFGASCRTNAQGQVDLSKISTAGISAISDAVTKFTAVLRREYLYVGGEIGSHLPHGGAQPL